MITMQSDNAIYYDANDIFEQRSDKLDQIMNFNQWGFADFYFVFWPLIPLGMGGLL